MVKYPKLAAAESRCSDSCGLSPLTVVHPGIQLKCCTCDSQGNLLPLFYVATSFSRAHVKILHAIADIFHNLGALKVIFCRVLSEYRLLKSVGVKWNKCCSIVKALRSAYDVNDLFGKELCSRQYGLIV